MTEETVLINRLSLTQEILLSFLPVASAILSICGGCTIIYVALKEKGKKKWTPYTRLLLGMSISDIIVSATLAVASFLRPKDKSVRLYALGSDATCFTLGFFNQIGTAAYFYNAMLAIYFLLTARFGYKNFYISQCIEPFMHFISVGYPLMSAAMGSAIEIWGEVPVHALGCYISKYNSPIHIEQRLFFMFFAIPLASTFFILLCCNSIVAVHTWKATRNQSVASQSGAAVDDEYKKRPIEIDESRELTIEETTLSPRSKRKLRPSESNKSRSNRHQKMQNSRLRLVRSQAILYVGGFFLSNFWIMGVYGRVRATCTKQEELDLLVDRYGLFILEAMFHPSQGFFNMFVFLRPKFWKARQQYPQETRSWAIRRAVFGEDIEPSSSKVPSSLAVNGKVKYSRKSKTTKPPPDLDSEEKENDRSSSYNKLVEDAVPGEKKSDSAEKESETGNSTQYNTHKASHDMWSTSIQMSNHRRVSSLEVISEISASVFEPFDFVPVEETKSSDLNVMPPTEKSEHRWSSSSSYGSAEMRVKNNVASISPVPPQRLETEVEHSQGSLFEEDLPKLSSSIRTSNTSDTPILAPRRRMSPPDITVINDAESSSRWT